MKRATVVFFVAAVWLSAQQVGENASPAVDRRATFTSSSQLVVETVAVTDKQGRAINGLMAKDFSVTEDGIPQSIRFVEVQKLDERTDPAKPEPENIHIYDKLGRTQISPERPGSSRYKDHRLLALYFDTTATPPADQLRALGAAVKFVRTQMTSADLIAIFRYAGGLGRRAAGFHSGPRPSIKHSDDDDRGRRPGIG